MSFPCLLWLVRFYSSSEFELLQNALVWFFMEISLPDQICSKFSVWKIKGNQAIFGREFFSREILRRDESAWIQPRGQQE